MYVGKNWLGYEEDEIWEMTPRKFYALLKVYYDLRSKGESTKQDKTGYIDNIPGWN